MKRGPGISKVDKKGAMQMGRDLQERGKPTLILLLVHSRTLLATPIPILPKGLSPPKTRVSREFAMRGRYHFKVKF